MLLGVLLSALTTTTFYLITAYTPTFGKQVLDFVERDNLIVTLCVGFSNFFWLPIGGAISDRIGRRPMLRGAVRGGAALRLSRDGWLTSQPSFARLLIVQLWFSFIFGTYNGALIPFLTEMMPPLVRTSGFSLAFSLATALFGGLTPAICHLPDPCDRQSGHARRLAQRRGHTGSLRSVGFEAIHPARAGGRASHGLDHVRQ